MAALSLFSLDALVNALPWAGILHYGYKITPPDLVGTMAAMIAMFQFVIGNCLHMCAYFATALNEFICTGKGIGSFVGGQLNELLGTPNLFKLTGASTVGAATLVIIVYHTIGKKWEKKVLEEKRVILKEMELRELKKAESVNESDIDQTQEAKL